MNEFTTERQKRRHLRTLVRKHLNRFHPTIPAKNRAGMAESGGDYAWDLLVAIADGASMEEARGRAIRAAEVRHGGAGEEAWSALHATATTVLEEGGFISRQEGSRPDIH